MNGFLRSIVNRIVHTGNLAITGPDGGTSTFGDGSGPRVHVAIHTRQAALAIALDPTLEFAERFMGKEVDFLEGDVLALLKLVYQNIGSHGTVQTPWTRPLEGARNGLRRLQQLNTHSRSKRNVQRHYDLSADLYKLFLDKDMQYSCAYFERPDMSLEEAQLAKKRHIMSKLQLEDGQCVLDIGCGWGGLGLEIARNYDADVLGVTLSTEQHAIANQRAQDEGLDQRVHFEIKDYRDIQQRFDRIVSVGMFEHVGVNHYRTFFAKCATLLKPGGVMVLHSIGRFGVPMATNAFIRKYIFPGGYIPALSEVMPAVERSGLMVGDIEILRLHYAETLKAWRERFMANRDKAKAIYDERFCRMWEFYLSGSEAAFRWQDMMNFQIQLTKKNDTLPMTRAYMADAEKALWAADAAPAEKPAPRAKPAPAAPALTKQRRRKVPGS